MKQRTLLIPDHVAIIMDGNGRWAAARGRPRWMGHIAGARALRAAVEHCARTGVSQLTVYAFSSDNWQRPLTEVAALLELFELHFRTQASSLEENGIRLSVIGRRDRFPLPLTKAIADSEASTAGGRRMHLRVALDYSSRAAIQRALAVSGPARSGETLSILPPVDLLIRTGGERRLSDFLLWECAYAEFVFLDTLWPDVDSCVLDTAFNDFASRDRRFGRLLEQESA